MPAVSVITPVHADTRPKVDWLRETLESVNAQTLSDFEVIVIDDCSTHPVGHLKDSFDGRFRFLKTASHQGPATVRNSAVALARSEAILPLDADDLLAENTTLQTMYESWLRDKNMVVYGDLQRIEDRGNGFKREKIIKLADYEFRLALNLNGLLPVTAMHSRACHEAAGGWKPELDSGMEDVEYWIAAGKAGFCGRHLSVVTLLYRWHEKSRSYNVRHILRREGEMRRRIQEMHEDVYGGRYPMGCCGSGGRTAQAGTTPRNQAAQVRSVSLAEVPTSEKVWVQYQGKRSGSFGVVGAFTRHPYQVLGPGSKLEVHVNDLSRFRRSGRGKDFLIGVPAPRGIDTSPEPAPQEAAYRGGEPRLAELERLDDVATEGARQAVSLSALDVGAKTEKDLANAGWTVERLADADLGEIAQIKGIGLTRASQISNRAKEVLSG